MRHRWIAAVAAVAAIGYATGKLVALLLESNPSIDVFSLLVKAGLILFLAVAVVAGYVGYRARREEVRWGRVLAEQRLWESGRLGRLWLARRRKLSKRDPW